MRKKEWFCLFALILALFEFVSAQPFDYPIANLSSTWINSASAPHSVRFTDSSIVRAILLRGSFGPKYACGFYCNGTCDSYLFAVFIVQTNSGGGIGAPNLGFPQVVWSANRNTQVKLNSTLQLTAEGDLVLRDVDGTLAWSTNTSRKGVKGLNMTEFGNLVLFGDNNLVVWQSFAHPTDCLVPGQRLFSGQKLTSSVSETNWTQGLFSMAFTSEGLYVLVGSNPPQAYTDILLQESSGEPMYVQFRNGSLELFYVNSSKPVTNVSIHTASSAQYMRLRPDGHLKVYEWAGGWKEVADLTRDYFGACNNPMVCGVNGICSKGQCSCPRSSSDPTVFFRQINDRQPNLGCSAISQLTCNASQYHSFVYLEDLTYFTFNSDIYGIDVDTCKEACLRNCSCKAALFRYSTNSSEGDCYLPSEIFSLMSNEKDYTHFEASAHLKVQTFPTLVTPSGGPTVTSTPRRKKNKVGVIVGSIVSGFFMLILIIGVTIIKKRKTVQAEEDYLDHVPGMPSRLSYEELRIATENFSTKLGQGGFGSVYEGILKDGTKIAVKCLDGSRQITKSFLAEVESIGSIHHINLVRLVGFCAEKSHRLLVYEYMTNGSLDGWIYHKNLDTILDFKSRKRIIRDVAKGLAYLHEACRQKIIHLDIKPQNILLDENFDAKLSDFGLSKLIDRDQSKVVTTMRGTPGYLAPEWLSAVITEKVDVYSFGIVVLETLCGRKFFEESEPEDARFLLSLFKTKAEEGRLLDLVDKYSVDMQSHGEEVVEMMKIAAWCLYIDYARRPSMSVVVKVLDGVMDVDKDLDYNSLNPLTSHRKPQNVIKESTPLFASVLSGPR